MIDVAIEAAKAAGDFAYHFNTSKLDVSLKTKGHVSPVSAADKQAEKLVRKIISKKYPDHGFIGEELGKTKPNAKYHWVIDPIDGTRDFIRQNPLWCTLVAVLEDKKPIIGVCYFPPRKELFWAQLGKGAYLNGKKIRVSKVAEISNAYASISSVHHFFSIKKMKQLLALSNNVGASRYFDSYGYSLLWTGQADVVVAARGSIWDWVAPAVITGEAGGRFSDFRGKYAFNSGTGVFSNKLIHQQVLKILNG